MLQIFPIIPNVQIKTESISLTVSIPGKLFCSAIIPGKTICKYAVSY